MKKLIALVLALSMSLSLLAGCGSTEESEAPATEETGEATEDAGNDAQPGTTTETSDATPFKIGCTGPLTGDAAIYGIAVKNAIELAVEEINGLGSDIQFEFQAEDDVADGETAVNAYNVLMDWGMQILLGTVTSGACISVAAETYEDRVFTLTPSASSTDVLAGNDNVFQVCFSDPNQGAGSAVYMANNMADAKIAVIYRNDDAYSQGIRDTFISEAEVQGLDVVYEGTFTEDTQTDFSVQLTAAEAAGADTVFLPIYYQPASVILNQAAQIGYAPTFFGVDGMDGILTMEGFDTSLAEGVMLLTPFSADSDEPMTQAFVEKYQERYGEIPNQFAADGYDAVYIAYMALQEAGCTSDMSAEEICEALISVMPTITYSGLTGQGLTWNEEGEVSKDPLAVVIKDGAYVIPE
ncbi:MAG: ABC transporter substrate-binding protein [Lachnospiraceae bacterium]|nr:ABC transporter substrate-binding protein [Lachnospiraceae bacterium]